MSGILQIILTIVATILGTGGIGSILYIRLNRQIKSAEAKLKEAEAKSAEIVNLKNAVETASASNEEWIKLYDKQVEQIDELTKQNEKKDETINDLKAKIDKLYESKEESWGSYTKVKIENAKKDRTIAELNWYRCEINGCPYRKPPRKYGDMDFPVNAINPETNPDPKVL